MDLDGSTPRSHPIPTPPSLVVQDTSNEDVNVNAPDSEFTQHHLLYDDLPGEPPTSANLLSPLTMGDDTGDAGSGTPTSASSAPPNPFNFKTQVISTGPVKSVSRAQSLKRDAMSFPQRD